MEKQIYLNRLTKLGVSEEVANLATKYLTALPDMQDEYLFTDAFDWTGTEEGDFFWDEEDDKLQILISEENK